jgi:hypothetical protein
MTWNITVYINSYIYQLTPNKMKYDEINQKSFIPMQHIHVILTLDETYT